MAILAELIKLLVPVVISSLFAFLISLYVARRQLAPVILPKLIDFREAVGKALEIPPDMLAKVNAGSASIVEVTKIAQELWEKCRELIRKYKTVRPFVRQKHRSRIDKAVNTFERQETRLHELLIKPKYSRPEAPDGKGIDPGREWGHMVLIAFKALECMKKEVSENIESLSS